MVLVGYRRLSWVIVGSRGFSGVNYLKITEYLRISYRGNILDLILLSYLICYNSSMQKRKRPKPGDPEFRKHKLNFRVNDAEKELIVNYFGKISNMREFLLDHIQKQGKEDVTSNSK
jgi:hypothetical protein